RQRVTATCHIGPLDLEETQGYIEHRLKCAGSSGRPTFDSAAFEAVFKASGGIPRRVNLICDRLLLLGFLGNKDAFGLEDVNEVVSEIHDEAAFPANRVLGEISAWDDSGIEAPTATGSIDIDLAKLRVTPELAGVISSQIDALGSEHYDGRLRRLEGSVLRLERINLEILVMLQKLVAAVKKPSRESTL
ncbi:MAG: ATPase, partial [Polaromonas sp.]